MRIIETKAYRFDELSEQAKDTAFEKWSNSEREYFWMDDNLESIKQGLLHFDWELKDYSIDYWCASSAYIKIKSNHSHEEIEELDDFDCFTVNNPIESLEELQTAIEE